MNYKTFTGQFVSFRGSGGGERKCVPAIGYAVFYQIVMVIATYLDNFWFDSLFFISVFPFPPVYLNYFFLIKMKK